MRSLGLIVLVFGLVAACGGSSNSGDEGTGGKTGAGAKGSGGVQGTAPCLAQPRNGDSCSKDGVCDTNPACACVSLVVECNGNPPRGSGGNNFGQGGRGNQAEGGRTSNQGGRAPTQGQGGRAPNQGQGGFSLGLGGGVGGPVECGMDPQTGSDCSGIGECPGVQGCFCIDTGGVFCLTDNPGQGGAQGRGGSSGRGGRDGRGGRTMTSEGGVGPIENGGAPGSGGHVTSGGTSAEAGGPSEETIVCPNSPSVSDPCTGPDGVCPNAPACFCIGHKVQGSACGR